MKRIYFLFLAILFGSCIKHSDKQGTYCWHCTELHSNITGATYPYRDTCWDNDYPPQFVDQYGNDLQAASCDKK